MKVQTAAEIDGIRYIAPLGNGRDFAGWYTALIIPEKEWSPLHQWDVKIVCYCDRFDHNIQQAAVRTKPLASFNTLTEAKKFIKSLPF